MAALSKPPELKAIAPMVTWSDPDDGLWTRGGAIELGITAPWTLMMGADALMRRHGTDTATLGGSLGRLVQDLDGLADGGYGELPVGHFPAFVRHDLPQLGYERSRRKPEWTQACRVAGRHDEVDLPTFQVGGSYDIFAQGTLAISPPCAAPAGPPRRRQLRVRRELRLHGHARTAARHAVRLVRAHDRRR